MLKIATRSVAFCTEDDGAVACWGAAATLGDDDGVPDGGLGTTAAAAGGMESSRAYATKECRFLWTVVNTIVKKLRPFETFFKREKRAQVLCHVAMDSFGSGSFGGGRKDHNKRRVGTKKIKNEKGRRRRRRKERCKKKIRGSRHKVVFMCLYIFFKEAFLSRDVIFSFFLQF